MIKKALRQQFFKTMMAISNRIPALQGRVGHAIYPYTFLPRELIHIAARAEQASRQSAAAGRFVEVGCAYGATTVFLNKLMDSFPRKHQYFALDTFSGFTAQDVEHEVKERGKPAEIALHFVVNRKDWFDKTLESEGVTRVQSIQADVSVFDFSTIAPISFCLLDVDLYQPTKNALPHIFEHLTPGGIIIVDDCGKDHVYDGAELAYREFCEARNLPYNVFHGRLGIIEATVSGNREM